MLQTHILTLILSQKCCLPIFSFATIFKVLQTRSQFVKMLSECQTVTRRLILIQAICILVYGRDQEDQGYATITSEKVVVTTKRWSFDAS